MNKRIKELVQVYDSTVKVVDHKASVADDRAYGGVIRAVKGKLQEYLTEEMVKLAWQGLSDKKGERLQINSVKQRIPILDEYIDGIQDESVKRHILSKKADYYYNLSVDKHVFVDNKLVMGIECKSYTENAMIKRILVDFSLLKTIAPDMSCYLFQLESQLGGDYSKLSKVTYGSRSTHTLMSYFPAVKLNVVTLLEGERNIDKPIHKAGNFKPLAARRIKEVIALLQEDLKQYL